MQDGRLLFAHYALMPNRLGYCGGSEHNLLFEYCIANEADKGTEQLIQQFQAAYPYLRFISQANGIASPFHPKVVEAYWVGNSLLDRVSMSDYYNFMKEQLGPRMSKKALDLLIGKLPEGAHPHHSFHVLDVSMRTGALKESIDDLDHCRISWGEVQRIEGDCLYVSYQPLELSEGKLAFGGPIEKQVDYNVNGKGYLTAVQPGEYVSMHWDWVCDRLTTAQVEALETRTQQHMSIANQTL